MSGLIQMTPVELRSKAKQYEQSGSEISDILRRLETLQTNLQAEWKGLAFEEFDKQFIQLRPKVQEFSHLMHQIHEQLVKTANAVEEQDQLLSRNFGLS